MIVGHYTWGADRRYELDLYCDRPDCPTPAVPTVAGRRGPKARFEDAESRVCFQAAVEAGWFLGDRDDLALCPRCVGRGVTPQAPPHPHSRWRVAWAVIQRGLCYFCGGGLEFGDARRPHPNTCTLDHLLPLCRAGLDRFENTRAVCARCNGEKGDLTADEFRDLRLVLSLGDPHPSAAPWPPSARPFDGLTRALLESQCAALLPRLRRVSWRRDNFGRVRDLAARCRRAADPSG